MALELKQIRGNTYYLKGSVNSGVYIIDDNKCILIDTGLDETIGRQILRVLEGANLIPTAIINTHSHADHFGANAVVKQRSGARVYATPFEKAVIENPYLEPFYLFSAAPFRELENKFLMGIPCRVDSAIEFPDLEFDDFPVKIIPLKGHSPQQIGVATPDNVLFAADSYFSPEIIDKYKLPYFSDITNTLKTLESLKTSEYAYYLPCHGEVTTAPQKAIDKNISAIQDTRELILEMLNTPMTREEIMAVVVERYNIKLSSTQYVLTLSAVSAYLSHLKNENLLKIEYNKGGLYWKKK